MTLFQKPERMAVLLFAALITSVLAFAEIPEKISEMNLDKATREVDKEVIPENFKWVVRKKAAIRKEDGELIEDPETNTIDSLPPCAPRTINTRKIR